LPTPRAVICSPSHIRNMVPVTRVMVVVMRSIRPGSSTRFCWVSRPMAINSALHASFPQGDGLRVPGTVDGFELALAPDFRQDFRESLYRLVGALTGTGITVLMTMEIVQTTSELRFSPYIISFLSDDIILLRHVEIAGHLRKSLAVIKMRNSDHSKELWLYDITGQGLIVRQSLQNSHGTGAGTATLSLGAAAPSYPGLTDRERLVLRALLDNAVKFSPVGGAVTVGLTAETRGDGNGEDVVVTIADEGPGILPDELDRVFERFFRGNGGSQKSGTGLGLSIAKDMVELMGGTLTVHSDRGAGSAFTVRMPRIQG